MRSLHQGSATGESATAVNFLGFYTTPLGNSAYNATENVVSMVSPAAGVLRNLNVVLQAAPSAGRSRSVAVYLNGSATSLAVTVADAATTASNTVNTLTVAAGDRISIANIPTNTPNIAQLDWNLHFDTTNTKTFPLMSSVPTLTFTDTRYQRVYHGGNAYAWGSGEPEMAMIVPTSGTFKSLYVYFTVAPGAGSPTKSYTFTIMKTTGGVTTATALTVTVSATATTGSDLVNSFTVAAGDFVSIRSTTANNPAQTYAKIGIVFAPDNDGESFLPMSTYQSPGAGTTYNMAWGQMRSIWNSFESNSLMVTGAFLAKAFYVSVVTAPGASQSHTASLRRAGTSVQTATISGTATAANVVVDAVFTQGQIIDVMNVGSASVAASTNWRASVLIYFAPAATTTGNFFRMFN